MGINSVLGDSHHSQRGTSHTEYLIVASFLFVTITFAIPQLQGSIDNNLSSAGEALQSASLLGPNNDFFYPADPKPGKPGTDPRFDNENPGAGGSPIAASEEDSNDENLLGGGNGAVCETGNCAGETIGTYEDKEPKQRDDNGTSDDSEDDDEDQKSFLSP